jgi:crossover junction endodeoxyribonuclease RusA
MKLTFAMTLPPSVNGLYSTDFKTKRRFISKAYADWTKLSLQSLALSGNLPDKLITGPVEAWYRYGKPDNRRRDVESYAKAVSDLLVKAAVIADDSQIQKLTLEWVEGMLGQALVTVTTLDNS